MRFWRMGVVSLLAIWLSSCDVSQISELYLSDVIAAADTQASATGRIVISVEMPSLEKCEEYRERALAILTEHVLGVDGSKCERQEFDTFLRVSAKQKIVPLVDGSADVGGVTGLAAAKINDGTAIGIFYVVSKESFDEINTSFKSLIQTMPNLKLDNVAVEALNDTGEPLKAYVHAAYVDGAPVLGQFQTIEPKSRIMIRLPEVVIDAGIKYGGVEFLQIVERPK